jgi:type I restriction enzyme S subunit
MEGLPYSWSQTRLESIVDILDSQRIPINNNERQERLARAKRTYPYYGATGQVGDIDDFIFDGEAVLLGEDAAPFLEPSKAKAYIVKGKYWVNNHAHILRGNGALDNAFLCYQLNVLDYRNYVSGTTRLKLTQASLKELPIRLPPLNEQRRIVEKIETLFARLDKGEEALHAVQKQLARYRQSVLKAAVTGQLTADWRAKNAHRLEHGRDLLARIIQARRDNWSGRGRYKEPTALDTTDLPELPEGWLWASFDQLFEVGKDGGKKLPQKRYSTEGRFPVIDQGETPIGGFCDDESLVYDGELPVILFGDHTRRFKLVRERFICGADGVKIISLPALLPTSYSYLLLRSASFEDRGYSRHFQFVRKLAFPLAPEDEAQEIIERTEAAEANATKTEELLAAELTRSTALRQSILKDAFAGRLVPQDPTDEPATALLDRIKQACAAAPGKSRQKARG